MSIQGVFLPRTRRSPDRLWILDELVTESEREKQMGFSEELYTYKVHL